MRVVQPQPFEVEGPQPLLRAIEPGAPYPVEALGALRPAVEAAHRVSQAPVALAARSALAAASLAVQPFADVQRIHGGNAPLSLFALTIAASGERKSTVDKLLLRGLHEHEREASRTYRAECQAHQNSVALWQGDRERMLGEAKKASGNAKDELRADLEDLGAEPPAPMAPIVTTTEPTFEGLAKLYAVGQPSLGLFSDEGAQFLGGHAMKAENRPATVAGLCKLWDGAPINRVRGGDGAATLPGRRLALHLMVQPIAARPLLADPIASGQGFLPRFLIAEPASTIGTRLIDASKIPAPEAALTDFAARMRDLLATAKPTADGDPRELMPRELPLSAAARVKLVEFYNTVELAQGPGGELEHVKPFASRVAEHAARIAGVLTLWANLDAREVTGETMADAVKLARFYLEEAKRLTEVSVVPEGVQRAEDLRRWLLGPWAERAPGMGRDPGTVVPQDVQRYGPGPLREGSVIKAALARLVEAGWVVPLDPGAEVDGKARKAAFAIVRGEG